MSHEWMDEAECLGLDPEAWFPTSEKQMSRANWTAMSVCRRCPVRLLCLKVALTEQLDEGIFGGMLPSQRRQMNRKTKVKKEPEGWTVTQLESRAVAGSWHAAMSFAMRVAQ
jgi:WhiB family redox-sensing transcriptional regulator